MPHVLIVPLAGCAPIVAIVAILGLGDVASTVCKLVLYNKVYNIVKYVVLLKPMANHDT